MQKKIDQLLTEERQARANAQMRASTAEAKLAQVEGELAGSDSKRKRSFLGRNRWGSKRPTQGMGDL